MENILSKFESYRSVQRSGEFNMFDPRARELANELRLSDNEGSISKDEWVYIIKNYAKLEAEYEQTKNGIDYESIGDYWDGNGKYQEAYDNIWETQVPPKDESPIEYVEAVRCMGRLQYEYYNNGNCNSVEFDQEECEDCDGTGYEESSEDGDSEVCLSCDGDCYIDSDAYVTEYYADCLNKVRNYTREYKLVREVEKVMTRKRKSPYTYSAQERSVYNLLCDSLMERVLLIKKSN